MEHKCERCFYTTDTGVSFYCPFQRCVKTDGFIADEPKQRKRNAEIETLRSVKGLEKEISIIKQKIRREREMLTDASVKLSDMPRGGAGYGFDEALARIHDLETQRAETVLVYADSVLQAEKILSSVKDVYHRILYRLLYVEGFTVARAAKEAKMSLRTAERLKKLAEDAITFADVNQKDF